MENKGNIIGTEVCFVFVFFFLHPKVLAIGRKHERVAINDRVNRAIIPITRSEAH